jgi:hypothetical protein
MHANSKDAVPSTPTNVSIPAATGSTKSAIPTATPSLGVQPPTH